MRASKEHIKRMYNAFEELLCAYIINTEEVDKAKRQKRSMLKVYQEREKDLEYAFRDCFTECKNIMNELNIKE